MRVDEVYQAEFKRTLKEQIKSETSGDFGRFLKYTTDDRNELDVELLYKSMKGFGGQFAKLAVQYE